MWLYDSWCLNPWPTAVRHVLRMSILLCKSQSQLKKSLPSVLYPLALTISHLMQKSFIYSCLPNIYFCATRLNKTITSATISALFEKEQPFYRNLKYSQPVWFINFFFPFHFNSNGQAPNNDFLKQFTIYKLELLRKKKGFLNNFQKKVINKILISNDAIFLFTKMFVHVTLHILENHLSEDKTLPKCTNLTVENIRTCKYFVYILSIDRELRHGRPAISHHECLFMEDLEEKAISTAPAQCRRTLWEWCVDVILEKIQKGHNEKH